MTSKSLALKELAEARAVPAAAAFTKLHGTAAKREIPQPVAATHRSVCLSLRFAGCYEVQDGKKIQ